MDFKEFSDLKKPEELKFNLNWSHKLNNAKFSQSKNKSYIKENTLNLGLKMLPMAKIQRK